jgi:Zn-dependent peptidase ImmA (M78 family)
MNNAEKSASQYLEDLGINTYPIDPFEICKSQEIKIFEESFDGLEGILLFDGYLAAIGLNSQQTYLKRRKFSVAHELGHLNMDVNIGEEKQFLCTNKMIESFDLKNDIELRADQFASELLMPRKMIKSFFNPEEPNWDAIQKVSQEFDVSLMASAFKYVDNSTVPCCLVVSKKGVIQFYKPSNFFKYSLQMRDSRIVANDTFAFKALKAETVPNDFDTVSADIWISGYKVKRDSELLEWSLPLNSYGLVLTILWDDETVGVDDLEEDANSDSYYVEEKNYSYDGVDNFPWEPPTLGKKKR